MKKPRPKRRLDIPTVSGKFGTGATVWGAKHEYTVGKLVGQTTTSDLYLATPGVGDPAFIKIVRDPDDNDLAEREVEILSHVYPRVWAEGKKYLPQLVEVVDVSDEDGKRKALVFPYDPRFYSLAEVLAEYPQGVEPKHAAWMINRMLEAIHFANYTAGVVHGALLPHNFHVHADTHAGLMTEWSFAARDAYEVHDGSGTNLKPGEDVVAVDDAYQAWYPPEVLKKEPHNFSVDLWMMSKCAIQLLGGDPLSGKLPASVPKPIAGFLRYITLQQDPSKRPQEALKLHDEFGDICKQVFGPKKFHKFHMPPRA